MDPPPTPICRSVGLGYDQPVVTAELPGTGASERFEEGMVVVVTAFVWEPGVGAALGQEPVRITADGPEILTTEPFAA